MSRIKTCYLDHAATTPPAAEVAAAMQPYLAEKYGNPSALYAIGRESRQGVEEARRKVASLINASPDEVYFTSGGSESDNMASEGRSGGVRRGAGHVVTTNIEHHAVLETAEYLQGRGHYVTFVEADSTGLVDPADIGARSGRRQRSSRSCTPTTRSEPSSPSPRYPPSAARRASTSTPTRYRPSGT